MITPNWPAPNNIHALSTTRQGGVSTGVYESLNLSDYVGDTPNHVIQNREILRTQIHQTSCDICCQTPNVTTEPLWLKQQHGTLVVDAADPKTLFADGSYTTQKNVICSVFTADCLPVLLCDQAGTEIAAIHAGWRGLLSGVIESGIQKFQSAPDKIMAWLGPAIGPDKFEVGPEVRKMFLERDLTTEYCFKKISTHKGMVCHTPKFLANIYELAKIRLKNMGITQIYGGKYCTYSNPELFFSYRRDGQCGRMASMIWINEYEKVTQRRR